MHFSFKWIPTLLKLNSFFVFHNMVLKSSAILTKHQHWQMSSAHCVCTCVDTCTCVMCTHTHIYIFSFTTVMSIPNLEKEQDRPG